MGWDIGELEVYDDAVMHRMYEIVRTAMLFERENAPMWSESENTLLLREEDHAEKISGYGAFDGETMVGAALMALPQLDNLDKAFLEIWVEPERRRQGIGSALADYLADRARGANRSVLLAQARYPLEARDDHPYITFAKKNGFDLALLQIRRELNLPVADRLIEEWIDEATPHHPSYRFESYEGMLPPELIESFLHVSNLIAVDAPQGDESWEPEAMTPEAFEVRHRNNVEAGRRVYHTVAIDPPSGEVVAFTTVGVIRDEVPEALQWGTLVRSDHRGHRLGLAVKARALADLQRNHPERTRITTMNAEVNAQMVGINVRMGYEAVEAVGEFQRLLT